MKRIVALVVIVAILITIKNIVSSIYHLKDASSGAQRQKEQLRQEKQTNAFLEEQLKYVQTDDFIEQEARNKLGLVKKDEYIVLAPPPETQTQEVVLDEVPNWKKWVNLFL